MNGLLARTYRSPLFASTDLAELFDAMVAGASPASAAPTMPIDVVEDEGGITVCANVPGFAKDQVTVEFHEGVLTIAATRNGPATNDGASKTPETSIPATRSEDCCGGSACATGARPRQARAVIRERSASSVRRALHLPERVTGEGISAELADGVLNVRLPYAPKSAPKRISVH